MSLHLNDFYFSGTVVTTPETKTFQSNSKTQFDVEQTRSYNGMDKKTVVTVQNWHKGESHTQRLVPGDVVMIKGRFSSSPYKERNIMNLDAQTVVMLQGNQATPMPKDDSSIPF